MVVFGTFSLTGPVKASRLMRKMAMLVRSLVLVCWCAAAQPPTSIEELVICQIDLGELNNPQTNSRRL